MQKDTKPKEGEGPVTAAGPTKEEFINFVSRAKAAFHSWAATIEGFVKWVSILGMDPERPATATEPEQMPALFMPMWSWDRPSIHGSTGGKYTDFVLEKAGIRKQDFFDLPPQSGRDIHRVVERVHARLVQQFEMWYYDDPQPYSVQAYKDALKHLFYNCPAVASAAVIEKEVRELPGVFAAIAKVKGDYPPHPYH